MEEYNNTNSSITQDSSSFNQLQEDVQSPKVSGSKLKDFFKKSAADKKFLLLIIPIIATFFLVNFLRDRQSLNTSAATGTANVYFQSSSLVIPPNQNLQLLVNADTPVAFAFLELVFDNTKLKLMAEPDLSPSPLKRVVQVTSMDNANATGKITIAVALDPSSLALAPTGNFSIANLSFSSNTTVQNSTATLSFINSTIQIVGANKTVLTSASQGVSFTINPLTSTPTPIATILPTSTPVATIVPTATPTTVKSCKSCNKRKCDGVCDLNKEGASCSDCP